MIHSMTGFGETSEQADGLFLAVEVRSLNNRFFKAAIRLPDELQALEGELEAQLRRRLARGSIAAAVKVRLSGPFVAQQVDDGALLAYLDHLESLHARFASDKSIHIDLTALLGMPGVLRPSALMEHLTDRARPALARLTDAACDKVIAMRRVEGETTACDLRKLLDGIRDRLDRVRLRGPIVVQEHHQRLRTRIMDFASRNDVMIEPPDLLRELALFAEKVDIAEECARTSAHLEHFRTLIEGDGSEGVGRTMDFLAQELLREANTMASKSNDSEVSRAVVEIKAAVDRIKEQAQNVA